MGRIIVSEFVTLDGVFEDPGGAEGFDRGGWTLKFQDEGQMKYKLDETLDAEALLLGRATYEGFAAAWPNMTDPLGFADKMNAMPKYVGQRDACRRWLEQLHRAHRASSRPQWTRPGTEPLATCSSRAAARWCADCSRTDSSTSSG